MRIPPDIHARVLELTDAILDASQLDDAHRAEALYTELHDYCESLAATGRDHPFLWETLGDFTADDEQAISIYLRALPLATAAEAAEYAGSICLAVAERHSNLEQLAAAHDYALQAQAFAMNTQDLDLHRAVSQFLLDHSDEP